MHRQGRRVNLRRSRVESMKTLRGSAQGAGYTYGGGECPRMFLSPFVATDGAGYGCETGSGEHDCTGGTPPPPPPRQDGLVRQGIWRSDNRWKA